MMGSAESQEWVPLLDYAVKEGVSVSTLRRQIKSNKICFKLENGRYLILNQKTGQMRIKSSDTERLQKELSQAKEEIAELKMLIDLYEEKFSR